MNKFLLYGILMTSAGLFSGVCAARGGGGHGGGHAGGHIGAHPVRGYTKADGTYVRPHMAGEGPLASKDSGGSSLPDAAPSSGLSASDLAALTGDAGTPIVINIYGGVFNFPLYFFLRMPRPLASGSVTPKDNTIYGRLHPDKALPYRAPSSDLPYVAPSDSLPDAAGAPDVSAPLAAPSSAKIQAYFSPHGGCTDAIVREINAAQKTVWVEAYGFTSAPILAALKRAKQRGVFVVVMLDRSNATEKYSGAGYMSNAQVPVLIDRTHKIAHNKVMVVDDATLVTGSFNFSKSAEDANAENLLVLKECPDLIDAYDAQFRVLLPDCERLTATPTSDLPEESVEEKN